MKQMLLLSMLLAATLISACSPDATTATSTAEADDGVKPSPLAALFVPDEEQTGTQAQNEEQRASEAVAEGTPDDAETGAEPEPVDESSGEGERISRGHDELVPCFRFDGPRVVIAMIGDGMGPEQVHAGRLAKGSELSFEGFPARGTVTTRSADNEVTDSAASATAMATGRKVNNYVVSEEIPGDGRALETILESYQRCGRRVGMVTTSRVTHATPASFGAHHSTRWEEGAIFEDYLLGNKIDLIVGGGLRVADPAAIRDAGFQLIQTAAEFLSIATPPASPTMVLIGTSHLPFVADEAQEDEGLAELSSKALDLLDDGDSPIFLMIEGARIDHAGHGNDFARMWPEVVAFDQAVEAVASRYAESNDYVIFVTADHETGGLHDVRRNADSGELEASWTTEHHTAVPVGYYAIGAVPDEVPEVIDNTDVYDILRGQWPAE